MIDEWPIIEKRIPNFNMVFRPTVDLSDIDLSDLAVEDSEFESAFAKMNAFAPPSSADAGEKIRLSREEAEVFLLVDGKNTVTEVVESSKLGEFHTCKALYDLLERKIVEPAASRQDVRVPSISAEVHTEEPGEEVVLESQAPKFTFLYPILAVIVLAAMIYQARDPLRLVVLPFLDAQSSEQLKRTAGYTRLQALDSAVLAFYYVTGELPPDLAAMVQSNFIDEEDIVDPWARPFEYVPESGAYTLAGHTGDGRADEALRIRRVVQLAAPRPSPKE
jgi:hypothetical protein